MREIVTLQFGPWANYLGTHFWNTEESYFSYNPADTPSIVDHDIDFRAGIGSDGTETYMPRALIYDLKSGFGGLRKFNALYDVADAGQVKGLWDGAQTVRTEPPVQPSTYQTALETGTPTPQIQSQDVRYWSDFQRVFFHPRSLIPISSQSLTSELSAVESHAAGVGLFQDLDHEVGGLLDRDVRLFAEECDSLQGFQVFGSSDDAWGGFMCTYLGELREEYGKKAIWSWGVEEGNRTGRMKQYQSLANTSRTIQSLAPLSSAHIQLSNVPTRFPSYVHFEPSSRWNISALLCSAIETVTLPCRLRPNTGGRTTASLPPTMDTYQEILCGDAGRNLWSLQASAFPGSTNRHDSQEVRSMSTTNGHASRSDSRVPQHGPRNEGDTDHDGSNLDLPPPSNLDISFSPTIPTPQSSMPSLATTSPSSSSNPHHRHTPHIFTQIETNRWNSSTSNSYHNTEPTESSSVITPISTSTQQSTAFPFTSTSLTPTARLRAEYTTQPIVKQYTIPLSFPLLDSFPNSLFTFPSSSSFPPRNSTISAAATSKSRHQINLKASLSTSSSTNRTILAYRDIVVGSTGRAMGLVDVEDREVMYETLTHLASNYDGQDFQGDADGYGQGDSDDDDE